MEQFAVNLSGKVRRATLGGRSYLVAPLTLIVPGVLNGSQGPLFYPEDEIDKNPEMWNGVPIVVRHPVSDSGSHVSARSPRILNAQGIGYVFKAHSNGKLRAEGWFDEEAVKRIHNATYTALQAGKPLELSTGLFTDNEPAENGASYKGHAYTHVARNYRPDHLAILPDQEGACSVRDGCGVNVNANPEGCNQYKSCEIGGVSFEEGQRLGLRRAVESRKFRSDASRIMQATHGKANIPSGKPFLEWIEKTHGITGPEFGLAVKHLYGKGARERAADHLRLPLSSLGGVNVNVSSLASLDLSKVTLRHKKLGKSAERQAARGENPPSWAVDEAKWDKAKKIVGEKMPDCDEPYACIAYMYENIGGVVGNEQGKLKKVQNRTSSTRGEHDMGKPKPLTENQKSKIVDDLIENCGDCGWTDEDRETLNEFPDAQLVTMDKHRKATMANELIANAVRKAAPDVADNAFPDFIKAKMAAREGDCVDGKIKGGKADGEPCKPTGNEEKKVDEKKVTSEKKPITNEELLAAMTPEMKANLAFGSKGRAQWRAEAIERITANVEDEDAKAKLARKLEASSDELLDDMVLVLPKKEETHAAADYSGAAVGGPVANKAKLTYMGLPDEYLEPVIADKK